MANATTILWFRRDLRLADNPALRAACQRRGPILPVFVWDPEGEAPWAPGAASRWWLDQSLRALNRDLRAMGSRLLTRVGEADRVLLDLARETEADLIVFSQRHEPACRTQEDRVVAAFRQADLEARPIEGNLLHSPTDFMNKSGRHYQVFTPFYKACLASGINTETVPAPDRLNPPAQWPGTEALDVPDPPPGADLARYWTPGEAGARSRLQQFLDDEAVHYREGRDRPDTSGTSRLSPHLHFGEVSPRQVWRAAETHGALTAHPGMVPGVEAFLRQLVWREFSAHLLHHEPHTPEEPLRPAFKAFPWRDDLAAFQAWQEGRTGYPYVDAGMRELNETGWMHNRVRMAAASFLVKHLLVPWPMGARYFWERLVDADLANNTMGWQWVSGCGADAAPYFRIFNPITQGEKFDPEGAYVRHWVPELKDLSQRYLMRPWEASPMDLQAAGVHLGENYPPPRVDHRAARLRALAAYETVRKT